MTKDDLYTTIENAIEEYCKANGTEICYINMYAHFRNGNCIIDRYQYRNDSSNVKRKS